MIFPSAILALGVGLYAPAAPQAATVRGEVIVAEHCARCHAIGLAGESRKAGAPPFRVLVGQYSVAGLMDAVARGATPSHTGMPRFHLSPEEADALTRYVLSVQIGVGASRSVPPQ
jgi:mono/diheme cytochrome c family protein